MRPPLIGIDLAEPGRLAAKMKARPALREALFTKRELEYCDALHEPEEHLAARFAAKEATVKALGIDGFEPKEIEVVAGGAEVDLRLHGAVAQRAAKLGVEVSISITHLAAMAAAVAMATPRPDPAASNRDH